MSQTRVISFPERLKKLSVSFSIIVMLVGILVITGWALDIALLKSISTSWVAMKVNAAICFILSGITLLIINLAKPGRAKTISVVTFPFIIILIAVISLLEHMYNFRAGIDELFFKDYAVVNGIGQHGRISIQTAFCFTLLGFALLFSGFKKTNILAIQWLALGAGSVAFFSLIGYLFGAQQLFEISHATAIAFHTSCTILLLMLAILFLHPEEGMMILISNNSSGGKLFRKVFPLVVFLVLLLGLLRLLGEENGWYDNNLGIAIYSTSVIIVFGIILYSTAVSLSKKEEKLKESEERYRTLFELMDQGFCVIEMINDKNGNALNFRYLETNPAFVENTGLKDVLGKTILELVPNIETNWFKIYGKVASTGESLRFENELEALHRYYDVFAFRIGEEKSKRVGVLFKDISSQKQAEEKIKELNRDLEMKVEQRTSQYDLVNKELEAFTYSVSHDLRAPLRAVNSYAHILMEDYLPLLNEEGKEILERIHYNAKKAGVLVDELLDFSKLGRKELEKKEIDLNELTASVIQKLNNNIQHNAIIQISPLPNAYGDYSLVAQVFNNLLSNAIKYSSKKEFPVIEIFSEVQEGKVVFVVKDNGAGFDMRFADKLFGVFQRLHSEKEFEGNGVGLAIVNRIIKKHGGKIWAEGKVNELATFYFTLN